MQYNRIIDVPDEDEPKILALTGCRNNGEVSQILQLQIEQDGQDAYIDLCGLDAKNLVDKINEWRDSNGWIIKFHSVGIDLITSERKRQIFKEGFTQQQDLEFYGKNHNLADYAVYLLTGADFYFPENWNQIWREKRAKRSRKENLIKAAALIAAEIDILDKLEKIEVNTAENIKDTWQQNGRDKKNNDG